MYYSKKRETKSGRKNPSLSAQFKLAQISLFWKCARVIALGCSRTIILHDWKNSSVPSCALGGLSRHGSLRRRSNAALSARHPYQMDSTQLSWRTVYCSKLFIQSYSHSGNCHGHSVHAAHCIVWAGFRAPLSLQDPPFSVDLCASFRTVHCRSKNIYISIWLDLNNIFFRILKHVQEGLMLLLALVNKTKYL